MTKKDYKLIAEAIKQAKQALIYATANMAETTRSIDTVIDCLNVKLLEDNDRFDADRFAEACNS